MNLDNYYKDNCNNNNNNNVKNVGLADARALTDTTKCTCRNRRKYKVRENK